MHGGFPLLSRIFWRRVRLEAESLEEKSRSAEPPSAHGDRACACSTCRSVEHVTPKAKRGPMAQAQARSHCNDQ
eukprot:scaffold12812_cov138-Isochrysis_galbana.AAC.2